MKTRLSSKILLTGCLTLYCAGAIAQRDYSKVQIKPTRLTENTYMLQGAGGNIGVLVGADGTFLVDGQHAALTEKITATLRKISDQPVKYLLNTHWHHDHTGGNENFHRAGATIIGHRNLRKRLSAKQTLRAWNMEFPAMPTAALPTVTYTQGLSMHLNSDEIIVMHPANAHTDGDSVVLFKRANVLHMGDIFTAGRFPYIDRNATGSLSGVIKAVEWAVNSANEKTRVIPGHGSLSSRQDLKDYLTMLKQAHAAIAPLIAAGRSRAQVIAAKPLAALGKTWGQGFMTIDLFAEIIYDVESAK